MDGQDDDDVSVLSTGAHAMHKKGQGGVYGYGSSKKNNSQSYSAGKGRGTTPPKRPSSSSSSKQNQRNNNNNNYNNNDDNHDNDNTTNASVVEIRDGEEMEEMGSVETGANANQRAERDTEREMKRTIELLRLEIETYKGKNPTLLYPSRQPI